MKKTLLSKRLKLVPVNNSDEAYLYDLLRNPNVKKYLLDNDDVELKTIRKFIAESNALFQKSNFGLWIVQNLKTSNAIGLCGLFYFELLELLYVIHPEYQNNGFATEASLRVISYINSLETQYDVYASIDIPNRLSHRVAQNIGMIEVKEEINKNTNGLMKVYKL